MRAQVTHMPGVLSTRWQHWPGPYENEKKEMQQLQSTELTSTYEGDMRHPQL